MEPNQLVVYQNHLPNELELVEEIDPNKAVFLPRELSREEFRKKKLLLLRAFIEKDFRAADMKWTFFVAACQSSRYDLVLRPFPPAFVSEDNYKDIDKLLKVVEDVSPLSLFLQQIYNPYVCQVHDDIIDLLYWLFIVMNEPYLETLDKDTFNFVLSRAPCDIPIQRPDYIFQVVSSSESPAEVEWEILSRDYATLFAYHGNKLENFHCITHYGLQKYLCKHLRRQKHRRGKDICLSGELASKYAAGASRQEDELSCIALCEFLNHEDFVRCKQSTEFFSRRNRRIKDSSSTIDEDSGVNKYYVVSNADMVRVRYLVVYRNPYNDSDSQSSLFNWFRDHKVLTFILIGTFIFCLMLCSYFSSFLSAL